MRLLSVVGFWHTLKINVCGRNREYFRYLLAWTADMMQAPDEKKGVALVLRGEKGVGKSTFSDVIRSYSVSIQSRCRICVISREISIVICSDKLLIVAEESFWAKKAT